MLSSMLEREWAIVCAVVTERTDRIGGSFVLVTNGMSNGMSTHEREEYQQRSNKISKKSATYIDVRWPSLEGDRRQSWSS